MPPILPKETGTSLRSMLPTYTLWYTRVACLPTYTLWYTRVYATLLASQDPKVVYMPPY